jgi:hypothetical protein
MAPKKSKPASANDELDNLFDGLGEEVVPSTKAASKGAAAKSSNTASAEDDILAEFEKLGAQQPISRPHTPRISAAAKDNSKSSPAKRAAIDTPPTATTSARTSEEKPSAPRKSGDSTRSFHTSFTPSATSSDLHDAERKAPVAQAAAGTGGGWWGGLMATASAAVKTAEAAVKEIQQNEEAKRWAEQVKGNVGVLRGFGEQANFPLETSAICY